MTALWQALLFGVMGALFAWLAHRGLAAFHDGVRPFVRDVAEGRMDRAEAARSTWGMSLGFVAYYGAPFSLITGVMEKHILGLTGDWIAMRAPRGGVAAAAGFAWGVVASLAISGSVWILKNLPEPLFDSLLLIGVPVLYLLPLIPVVAVASAFGARRALAVFAVVGLAFIVVDELAADAAVSVSFGLGAVILLALALRERPEHVEAQPEMMAEGAREVRRGVLPLTANGALIGLAASLFWFAGEPAAVMLIALDHPVEAALVGILSWVGFIPLVTLTALTGRSYVSGGMPDGVSAPAFLVPPVAGVFVGAAVMAGEVRFVGACERLLARFPGLHAAGSAIRDGMLLVSEVALLIGGAMAAEAIWPGIGLFVVGGLWLVNEAAGVPVMRVAAGPLAALATGLLFNVHQLVA